MKKRTENILVISGIVLFLLFLCGATIFIFIGKNSRSVEQINKTSPNSSFSLMNCPDESALKVRIFQDTLETKHRIPILTYHRIIAASAVAEVHYIDGELNPMIILKEDFEQQMTYLKDHDFVTLSLAELYLFLTNQIEIPEKTIVLTFDDGYKDNFIETYPILKRNNFTAGNFLITSAITTESTSFNPEIVQYLSVKELEEACDVFDYQSHTHNFHRREINEQNEEVAYLNSKTSNEVTDDIHTSILRLDGENLAFAYPYGEYTSSTIDVLKELGFKMAFTTVHRAASPEDSLYEIPRFNMFASTTFEEFKTYVNQDHSEN